ncbi:hypothetical protein J8244_09570 [Corynebacterium tuberculostearicum]|uniref:hypothetical protein n=1 Tax=Corynebacterium tuberculostearicum TaxID=38304 RepID=UPI002665DE92|nr:hypothetical protein [Corynebacterium tuberculostearicum]WKE50368.1 hypothetical protein J8244_09570 [Corynebacterium tuberculostearicum]
MADQKNLNQYIDKRLRMGRPDRYNPNDTQWLDEIADSIPDEMIPTEEVRRRYMRAEVKRREGVATRSANRLLRNFNRNDQMEWHWWNEANEPIAIEWTEFDESGRQQTHRERVALRAAEPRDLRLWAQAELVRAQNDFDARAEAVKGAQTIADLIDEGGFKNFLDWATERYPMSGVA